MSSKIPVLIRPTALISLLFATLIISGCSEDKTRLKPGVAAPTFTLDNLAGGKTQFPSDFSGKTVLINFWADWCPPCQREMPEMEAAYQKYKSDGLAIIAINVGQDRSNAELVKRRLKLTYNIALDTDREVTNTYGVKALPTTFIVDHSGKLVSKIQGEITTRDIDRIISESKP